MLTLTWKKILPFSTLQHHYYERDILGDLFNNILHDTSFNEKTIENKDFKNGEHVIYDTDDEIINILNNKPNFKERLKILRKHIKK